VGERASNAGGLLAKKQAYWRDCGKTQEESDREADDFQTHEGLETIGEVLGYFVRKWRSKVDGEQTCADLDKRLRLHAPYPPPSIPSVAPDSKMEVMKASTIFGAGARKEFVFRKGVQTTNAPQNAPALEAVLAWLAEKARTVPESVREGSRYYFPYTHKVFRRLLAEIYNPTRVANLAGPAPRTPQPWQIWWAVSHFAPRAICRTLKPTCTTA
jgi:hypothetical protein